MKDYIHLFQDDSLHLEEHDQETLELQRKETARFCIESNKIEATKISCQQYQICLTKYFTKKGCWEHIGADIYHDQDLILHINRNYGCFWHYWIMEHPKTGHDYLLCGEDYQGYNVIDLTARINYAYLPKAAKQGIGWCWCVVEDFDKSTLELKVIGCHWACPEERLVFDFSDPTQMPLPILAREDIYYDDEDE